jgi:hypothetical protein
VRACLLSPSPGAEESLRDRAKLETYPLGSETCPAAVFHSILKTPTYSKALILSSSALKLTFHLHCLECRAHSTAADMAVLCTISLSRCKANYSAISDEEASPTSLLLLCRWFGTCLEGRQSLLSCSCCCPHFLLSASVS